MTLRVTFLGTSAAVPTVSRNPSSVFINRDGDQLLFDVGEGTQRQMMRNGTGFGVSDVFITHLHGDHVLGLPGLLQTWAFTDRTAPVTVYTPVGTRDRLGQFMYALEGKPSYPVHIEEVEPGQIAKQGDGYEIRVFATDHDTRSVGYSLVEDDRKGRYDRERAEEIGVPVGPLFSRLHAGESVTLEDGTTVTPDQVVGPPRPGRTVVHTGDTRPAESVSRAAENADLLIHDGTFASDHRHRARETAHSTAREAAEIAANAGAHRLVLTHISSRYPGDPAEHREEAAAVFDGTVIVAEDGLEIDVPFTDVDE